MEGSPGAMSPNWLVQKSGTDCQLYALANTLRAHGLPTPEPGSDEWEGLIDLVGARHGSAISMTEAAERFGYAISHVQLEYVDFYAPCEVAVHVTCYHAVLCIGVREIDGDWCMGLVNYNFEGGPAEDWVPIDLIDLCTKGISSLKKGARVFHPADQALPDPEDSPAVEAMRRYLARGGSRARGKLLKEDAKLGVEQTWFSRPFYRDPHHLPHRAKTFDGLKIVHTEVKNRWPDAWGTTESGVCLWFIHRGRYDYLVAEAWPNRRSRKDFNWPFPQWRARFAMRPRRV